MRQSCWNIGHTMYMCFGFIVCFALLVITTADDCSLDLKVLRENAPVYIEGKKIVIPSEQVLKFKARKKFTFACPGKKNSFQNPTFKQAVDVVCQSGKLTVKSIPVLIHELLCKQKQPRAIVLNTRQTCGGGEGFWKDIVFNYTTGSIPLFRTCYNTTRWEAIFSTHDLNGAYFQDAWRSNFLDDGMEVSQSKIGERYSKAKQIEAVGKIIGEPNAARFWEKDMLAKGHFSPCVDFNYCSTQEATFFYINTGPQWQKFNTANWKRLENRVRDLAKVRAEVLKVYTGVHGVLQLPDARGKLRDIYLNGDTLPVPKFFWKVIISEIMNEGIAFIGLNNPHANSRADLDALCPNVCRNADFIIPDFDDGKKGWIVCCEVKKARKKIGRMYDIPHVKALFNGARNTMGDVLHSFVTFPNAQYQEEHVENAEKYTLDSTYLLANIADIK